MVRFWRFGSLERNEIVSDLFWSNEPSNRRAAIAICVEAKGVTTVLHEFKSFWIFSCILHGRKRDHKDLFQNIKAEPKQTSFWGNVGANRSINQSVKQSMIALFTFLISIDYYDSHMSPNALIILQLDQDNWINKIITDQKKFAGFQ